MQQVATFLFFLKITLIECGSTFTFITSLLLVFDVYLCSMLKTKLSTQNAKNEILNERIFFLKYLEIFKKKFLKSMVYIHITKITTKIIDCFKLCTFVLGETIECLNRDHKHHIENHAGICFEIFE